MRVTRKKVVISDTRAMSTFRIVMYIAWAQSLIAVMMSLYFSEIRHFVPCNLCWYQRIVMYPLAVILPIAIVRKDRKVYQYVLPLTLIGMIISLYQTLLQMGVISESLLPCINGISCTTKYVTYFGFVTIPMLSLFAFSVITACMGILWKEKNHE